MNVTDSLLLLFQRMPFPKSVVLHFPAEIHRTQGVPEVAPQLLRAIDVQKIAAVQFLRNGRVRVTTKTLDYRDEVLEGSTFLFGDVPIPVTAADQPLRSVFVRELPVEVPDVDVKSVFESFGVIHSVHPCFFREFPSVANGTRRLVMSFRRLCPCLTSLCVFSMLVSVLRVLSAMNPVTCLGTALSRVCACAASSRVTWPEIVRSPGVRPLPVLLCLLRLRLFPLLS